MMKIGLIKRGRCRGKEGERKKKGKGGGRGKGGSREGEKRTCFINSSSVGWSHLDINSNLVFS